MSSLLHGHVRPLLPVFGNHKSTNLPTQTVGLPDFGTRNGKPQHKLILDGWASIC